MHCPHCGYCSQCGRRNYSQYPYYNPFQWPYYTVTCQTAQGQAQQGQQYATNGFVQSAQDQSAGLSPSEQNHCEQHFQKLEEKKNG
jgi:hypothetical protein